MHCYLYLFFNYGIIVIDGAFNSRTSDLVSVSASFKLKLNICGQTKHFGGNVADNCSSSNV